jgi:hypothetical protein
LPLGHYRSCKFRITGEVAPPLPSFFFVLTTHPNIFCTRASAPVSGPNRSSTAAARVPPGSVDLHHHCLTAPVLFTLSITTRWKPPLFLFRALWCLAPLPLYAVVRRPPHRTRCRHGRRDHLLESLVGFAVFPASCRRKLRSKPSPITRYCVRRRNSGHLPARSHRAPSSTAARPLASHQDRLIQDRRTRSLTPSL